MPIATIPEVKTSRPAAVKSTKKLTPIPESLVYEMVNDLPIYYHRYRDVANGRKQAEEIMGSSFLQSLLISRIVRFLMAHLPAQYEVLTNELGLQFSKGNWRAADIAIYRKERLRQIPRHNKYLEIPPEIVIEIDTKAAPEQFSTMMDYYYTKTDDLLAFGVEKVVWIFTDARKVMIAEPQIDWITRNWEHDIPIFEKIALNLTELLSDQ